MNFWKTLLIAFIPAILTGALAFFGNRLDYLKYKSETMAERTAKKYLSHKSHIRRKFKTIQKRLGAYDSNPNLLREVLVRAGAERSYGKDGTEYWMLISRQDEWIKRMKNKRTQK